jgi:hypothetical protein
VSKLIHISEVFDFEEDNDKIGDTDDPLFNGSLKEHEVALDLDGGEEGSMCLPFGSGRSIDCRRVPSRARTKRKFESRYLRCWTSV